MSAAALSAVLPGTTAENTLEWLRSAIVARRLRPGQKVLQEEIAQELGVSIAPVREALRVLEQEGQVTYRPRRGYFVTELSAEDLREIYELRRILEERAARLALPCHDADSIAAIAAAARECAQAAEAGEVARELQANRRFHFELLQSPGQVHALRIIRLLWDATEAYRAIYYNSPRERRAANAAHARILAALRARDADRLVRELDAHRERALHMLEGVLAEAGGEALPGSRA